MFSLRDKILNTGVLDGEGWKVVKTSFCVTIQMLVRWLVNISLVHAQASSTGFASVFFILKGQQSVYSSVQFGVASDLLTCSELCFTWVNLS